MLEHIHPALSSLPFSMLFIILILELISFSKIFHISNQLIFLLLSLLVIFTILTFFSGYIANIFADGTYKIDDKLISYHHFYGRFFLILVIPIIGLKFLTNKVNANNLNISKKMNLMQACLNLTYFTYLLILLAFAVYTQYLGGQLVFRYGAGVNILPE